MDRRFAHAAVLALAAAPAVLLSLTRQAQAQSRCTRETLSVRGTPLTAAYCVTGIGTASPGNDLPVHVSEEYSTGHGSWSQAKTLQFIAGEPVSRVIEDLPLEKVGLQGTLHLTLALHGGEVRIDSAMLTPGAITVK